MGATISLLKLGDFVHQNANLQLDCRACDHRGVVSAQRAQRWFAATAGTITSMSWGDTSAAASATVDRGAFARCISCNP